MNNRQRMVNTLIRLLRPPKNTHHIQFKNLFYADSDFDFSKWKPLPGAKGILLDEDPTSECYKFREVKIFF